VGEGVWAGTRRRELLVVRGARDVVDRVAPQRERLGGVGLGAEPVGGALQSEVRQGEPSDDVERSRPGLERGDDVDGLRQSEVELVAGRDGGGVLVEQRRFDLGGDVEGFEVEREVRDVADRCDGLPVAELVDLLGGDVQVPRAAGLDPVDDEAVDVVENGA
jgi:hypothetical protein